MAASICDFEDGPSPTSDTTTDVSEDSIEVKVQPVAMPTTPARRNKRKSSEPRKLKDVPLPKQRHWENNSDVESVSESEPSSPAPIRRSAKSAKTLVTDSSRNRKSNNYLLHSRSTVSESLSRESVSVLLGDDDGVDNSDVDGDDDNNSNNGAQDDLTPIDRLKPPFSLSASTSSSGDSSSSSSCSKLPSSNCRNGFLLNLPFDVRNILGPSAEALLCQQTSIKEHFRESVVVRGTTNDLGVDASEKTKNSSNTTPPNGGSLRNVCLSSASGGGATTEVLSRTGEPSSSCGSTETNQETNKQKQRNYKNMTRERRIEANARERTRVHTISAAFENLRRAVPSYSCHQKLSKLAILRIACSYILALANLNDMDYSLHQDCPSFSECVDLCTRTIQAEGKARKRKVRSLTSFS